MGLGCTCVAGSAVAGRYRPRPARRGPGCWVRGGLLALRAGHCWA